MVELLLGAQSAFVEGRFFACALLLYALCLLVASAVLNRPADSLAMRRWLARPGRGGLYRSMAGWIVRRVDASAPAGRGPFTLELFDRSLALALAYPAFLFLASVLYANLRVGFADGVVLAAERTLPWLAAALSFALTPIAVGAMLSESERGWRARVAIAVLLLAVFAGPAFETDDTRVVNFASIWLLFGYVALFGGSPVGICASIAVAGATLLFSGAGAGAARVAATGASQNVVSAVSLAGGLIGLWAPLTLLVAVANGFLPGLLQFARRWWRPLLLLLGPAVALAAALIIEPPAASPDRRLLTVVMVLFLVALPIVNAVFDFLSAGATIALARRGLERPSLALALGLADLALAGLVLLPLLGLAMVAVVMALNGVHVLAGGGGLIDVGAELARLQVGGAEGWWMAAICLTTILPTLLHASLACFSIVAWLPRVFRLLLRRAITRAPVSTAAYFIALFGVGSVNFAYVVAPAGVLLLGIVSLGEASGLVVDAYLGSLRIFVAEVASLGLIDRLARVSG